jgi:hypothetical protein
MPLKTNRLRAYFYHQAVQSMGSIAHYYTYIKGYERDERKVFMDKVYNPYMEKNEKPVPFLSHNDKREKDRTSNSPLSLQK